MSSQTQTFDDVNRVKGLIEFLYRWDHKDELKFKELQFDVAPGGNINLEGTAECNESFLLTRWHSSFAASIEAGVRELVMQLVADWDCVTYSSCEGHRSTAQAPFRVRHVRLVSRNKTEHLRLSGLLSRLVDETNAELGDPAVRLAWKPTAISAEDGLEAPGLDVIFEPRSSDESAYWKFLDASYRKCLLQLTKETDK